MVTTRSSAENWKQLNQDMLTKTLYKASKTGKTVQLTYELDGNMYRAIHGYVDGKLVTDAWTIAEAKNVGKSNEVSAVKQATAEVMAKMEKKRKEGYTEDKNGTEAARPNVRPMLAKVWDKYKAKVVFPVGSQPKLDGIRMETEAKGFFSRENNLFVTVPHLQEEVEYFMKFMPKGAKLDGELYNELLYDDFNKITSLIKRDNVTKEQLTESKKLVQYHIYDIDVPGYTFKERNALLIAAFVAREYEYLHYVDTTVAHNVDELNKLSEDYLRRGYEGQMVRVLDSMYEGGKSRSKNLLKRKPFMDAEFILTAVHEGTGNRSGMAGSLSVKSANGKISSDTGIKGGVEFYKRLWKDRDKLIGSKVTVRFQNYTEDNSLRIPVTVAIRDYE